MVAVRAVQRWLTKDPPSPFRALPRLETERLILRALDHRDAADLFAIDHDPSVAASSMRYALRDVGEAEAELRCRMRDRREGRPHPWGVVERTSGRVVGTWGAWHRHGNDGMSVGYGFALSCHGRGYATEAGAAACRALLEMPGVSRLVATVFTENAASIRVLEKLGFVPTGGGPDRVWWNGTARAVREWERR